MDRDKGHTMSEHRDVENENSQLLWDLDEITTRTRKRIEELTEMWYREFRHNLDLQRELYDLRKRLPPEVKP